MRLFYNILFIPLFLFGMTFNAFGQCENDTTLPVSICNAVINVNLSGESVTLTPDLLNESSNDNCTSAENLTFRLELEATFDGTLPSSTEVTLQAEGTYSIVLWVVDEAGNANSCFSAIIVEEKTQDCTQDTAPPVLECLNGLQTIDATIVFAQDFVRNVFDNCTDEQNLTYGLQLVDNFTGNMPTEMFIDFQEAGIYSVYVWVADAAGNSTYCKTQILINETITITGYVFADNDGDCRQGIGEDGLNQLVKVVLLENGQPSYTAIERSSNGAFSAKIPFPTTEGAAFVTSLVNEDVVSCQPLDTYPLDFFQAGDVIGIEHIGVQLTQGCADLGVTVEAVNGNCNEEGAYVIKFHNAGSEIANPVIKVDFSNKVNFTRIFGTHGYEYASDTEEKSSYSFQIKNLLPGSDGNIFIIGQQVCDFTNQTQVTTAEISADNACSNNFAGARINITQECLGDEVEFKIQNIGGDMLAPTNFIVVEDVIMRTQGTIQLGAGESEILTFPATGSTYYVSAEQASDYPWQASIAKVSEGCATDVEAIKTGIVAQLPLENLTPHIDVDVIENTPILFNTLAALPKGVGENHLVTTNTAIEYAVEYANTNDAVAKDLNITVEVSEHLDLNTLKITYATHTQYNLTVEGRILNFTFPNLNLVNSNVSKEEGSGLLKFAFAQNPDLEEDTKIESKVTITFDGKEVAGGRNRAADVFFHTIGDLPTLSTAVKDILQEEIGLTVFPNPFNQYTTIRVQNPKGLALDFELYNANGQLMQYQQVNQPTFTLQRNDLKNGFYFYVVKHQGQPMNAGKLFIE